MPKEIATTMRKPQSGIALIEALIGMLVLSLVTLGTMLALAQGAKTQHINGVRAQVIEQKRIHLMGSGVSACGTTIPLSVASNTMTANVTCEALNAVTVEVPGAAAVTVTVPASDAQIITSQTTSPLLGGTLKVSAKN